MNFRDSLNRTMNMYSINNTQLGDWAGIAAREISLYRRNKKGINDKTLYKLFSALPSEAKAYCVALMLIEDGRESEQERNYKKSAESLHA